MCISANNVEQLIEFHTSIDSGKRIRWVYMIGCLWVGVID